MSNFKEFVDLDEAYNGYVLSSLMVEVSEWLNEGRKDRMKLAGSDFTYKPRVDKTLFGDEEIGEDPEGKIDKHIAASGKPQILGLPSGPMKSGEGDSCEITPLSGYSNHIGAIQAFAKSSPANFAQTLMFSPLSANVPFAKHWDNYQVLMMALKHNYPNKITPEELSHLADSFGDKYHKMAHSIAGWKLDTVADIWSNKEGLFQELNGIAKGGDDVALIKRLSQIKGVQPVKAGFIAQLLWGRAGCIDTHNIDIYSKVFPDMDAAGDFNEKKWAVSKGASDKKRTAAAQSYMDVLGKLDKRGIGTKQLWDVWVDFVETMYVMITSHGRGYYDMQGGALGLKSTRIWRTDRQEDSEGGYWQRQGRRDGSVGPGQARNGSLGNPPANGPR